MGGDSSEAGEGKIRKTNKTKRPDFGIPGNFPEDVIPDFAKNEVWGNGQIHGPGLGHCHRRRDPKDLLDECVDPRETLYKTYWLENF